MTSMVLINLIRDVFISLVYDEGETNTAISPFIGGKSLRII